MIMIDGAQGEGGGQILRSSLALSLVTGRAFSMTNIRAGRKKPGLLRQHLTAVKAAAGIGRAEVKGDSLGSLDLEFRPGPVTPGEYTFAVGTAGSATLVLQSVLPALLTAGAATVLHLEGGTHNPYAPPYDFLAQVFLPLMERMGPKIETSLDRYGFYPAGGGRFSVTVTPSASLKPFELTERGEVLQHKALALVSQLPLDIAARELKIIAKKLDWDESCLEAREVTGSQGPGNILMLMIESEHGRELITSFGERGIKAEHVALEAAKAARKYLEADVPVGRHLADQLMIPMALAGGGRFVTQSPTRHTQTNAEVIKQFLDIEITIEKKEHPQWEVIIR